MVSCCDAKALPGTTSEDDVNDDDDDGYLRFIHCDTQAQHFAFVPAKGS